MQPSNTPERRLPIVLRKPDPSINHLVRGIHDHGFTPNPDDWLYRKYGSLGEAKQALEVYGRRELSAIQGELLIGVEEKVSAKEPERGLHGMVIVTDIRGGTTKPLELFSSQQQAIIGKDRRSPYYDSTFRLLNNAFYTTYSDGIREHLLDLVHQGLDDPKGPMASVFARLENIYDFAYRLKASESAKPIRPKKEGFEVTYNSLRGNLLAGVTTMSAAVKLIPLVLESYGASLDQLGDQAGVFLQPFVENTRRFIAEQTLMDTRISRQIDIWEDLLKGAIKPEHLRYFQLSVLGQTGFLDFSDPMKQLIHELELAQPESAHHYGCAAARFPEGERSLINTIWDRYVALSKPIYEFFFNS